MIHDVTKVIGADQTDWSRCPECGSAQIRGDELEMLNNEVYQLIQCDDCGLSWHEVYQAAFREILNNG